MPDRPDHASADDLARTDEVVAGIRDDLDVHEIDHPLAVEVRNLREDLAAYRWSIERILRRRLWAVVASAALLTVLLVAVFVGWSFVLDHEAARSQNDRQAAHEDACAVARSVQGQTLAILLTLDEAVQDRGGDRPGWLDDALAAVAVDPCADTDGS